MPSETLVQVDFGKPIPLFPLDRVVLLPHGIAPMNIFEPRYRQMIGDALDSSGLIAMCVFTAARPMGKPGARPPLRPAVCLGNILNHAKQADGTYIVILQGVCRARTVSEIPPDGEKLYRRAMLEPVGVGASDPHAGAIRESFADALEATPLRELRNAAAVAGFLRKQDVPADAVLELASLALFENLETRYRLLAAGEPAERARIFSKELRDIARLIRLAGPQREVTAPKGCSWN